MEQTSVAAQVILAIIPIVGIVIGGIVVFFYLLWRHREMSLQIKTENYKPLNFDFRIFSLLTGILLTAVGFVLSVFFILIDGLTYGLLGGLIPFAVGIGLLVFYKIYSDKEMNKTRE